jgi:hypothetical protein
MKSSIAHSKIPFVHLPHMRGLFALFLALVTLIPTLLRFGMVADYFVRYDRYATELCENLDKPEMNCNGKCRLGENMNKVEQSELPIKPQPHTQKLPEILGSTNELPYFKLVSSQLGNILVLSICCDLKTGFISQVFQPPTSIC